MWIQIRTIDGKETRTVEDLSRLTKIECLRVKIRDIFQVKPEQQRLFYRGKQMEDGQTLFDYNVGLNDIVQLLIRSQTDAPDSPSPNSDEGVACAVAPPTTASAPASATPTTTVVSPATVANSNGNGSKPCSPAPESQPSTSSRTLLLDPGIGLFRVNELVDCRDVSIGAWFEGVIEKVSPASKGQNGRVGRPSKRTNNKLESEPSSSSSSSSRDTHSDQPSTSQTDPPHVSYHIKYEEVKRTNSSCVVQVNELVDCRDVSIGAWFEGVIEKVSPASKGQNGRVGRPSKRTNNKLESEPSSSSSSSSRDTHSDQPSTSQTDPPHVSYHIKYEDYPENGVVEMSAGDVRPRARTLLRFDQLQVGELVMVNYNLENPEERGFWYDAEISTLNAVSRTNKEIRVKILLGGPGDVIGDCKLQFLDEIYRIEKPGAPALSAADGPFKRKSGPECKHCKADPDAECRFCSCCVCGGKQDAHMQLLCDECNMAFHIYCLTPPLTSIPEDEDCRNEMNKRLNKHFLVCYFICVFQDRGDEFTYTGSGGRDLSGNKRIGEHSFDQTLTHMNRALALNCDAPLNDKDGAESRNWRAGKPVRVIRSSKGRRISKYAPEEGNRYDGIYKVVKYWPEIGKCGFLVWRYLLRRDDLEPAPWTTEGIERSKKLGLKVQNFLRKVEQMFMCVCCQELSFQPVTTECSHNVCKV
ncbi:E3 ubiquitin-protein ligase UHRF2-like [Sinocyclocheilus grahami]|uniref:E3 ubiquitin-protein ligase UHRF2-like n=1 Tax=Sinocyclocheilus grahami TaxID=75366 RepID=UPI0007AD0AE0|nr:PREDICTED: E3 ubiquitin-protein ligase UHRF2-like [Sinocyclocheilus grahami]